MLERQLNPIPSVDWGDRLDRLNELEFVWDIKVAQWMETYELFVECATETGDSNPAQRFIYKGRRLGAWLNSQRQNKKKLMTGTLGGSISF